LPFIDGKLGMYAVLIVVASADTVFYFS